MKDFGLAGEGVTDQIVLENVLFGLYGDVDEFDEDEISYLQPLLDATDEDGLGSWTRLLTYLDNKRFRADVLNHQFVIIQVDTDVAAQKGFEVVLVDENNQPLPVEAIIENVRQRLIAQMDVAKQGFYNEHKGNIVFAISVHSLECWLFNLHNKNPNHVGRISSCESHLRKVVAADKALPKLAKNKPVYDELSGLFYKKKGKQIAEVAKVDTSFRIFIESLQSLPYPS